MKTPILSLNEAKISFGQKPLFEALDLHIYQGDRICLTGKNGEGKSTIVKLITGEYELDGGKRWVQPGFSIGYLPQESIAQGEKTVIEYVLSGLDKVDDNNKYLADIVLSPLELERNTKLAELSGGQRRRASLARAIVSAPDILLLDEPTNHLDVEAIIWLENYLKSFDGAVLCISHDRAFLNNFSNKVFWLDRGELRVLNKGYKYFDDWSCDIIEQEQKELDNLERKMKLENVWLAQGVTARRKRNQRRLKEVFVMRDKLKADRVRMKNITGEIELEKLAKQKASKIAVEFSNVSHAFGDKVILKNYNDTVLRGEKIGIIGKNGSGKSTYLNMLVGAIEPNVGKVKVGKNIRITYFDQIRSELDKDAAIKDILAPSGNDHLMFRGNFIHVAAYLKKFMFDPKLMHAKASTLSGGQANRLLLAKALADPGNLIILDEPTNDLDVETLDMLQEYLAEYEGTAIIVSHDRDFIDRTVTKTVVFEGEGNVKEVIGGYSDYIAFLEGKSAAQMPKKQAAAHQNKGEKGAKLTFKLQYEYDNLPKEIKHLEEEIAELEALYNDPDFYSKNAREFARVSAKLKELRASVEEKELRWLEIAQML